jgi:hypothetical protein
MKRQETKKVGKSVDMVTDVVVIGGETGLAAAIASAEKGMCKKRSGLRLTFVDLY